VYSDLTSHVYESLTKLREACNGKISRSTILLRTSFCAIRWTQVCGARGHVTPASSVSRFPLASVELPCRRSIAHCIVRYSITYFGYARTCFDADYRQARFRRETDLHPGLASSRILDPGPCITSPPSCRRWPRRWIPAISHRQEGLHEADAQAMAPQTQPSGLAYDPCPVILYRASRRLC
jgi:hypothetical protein